MNDTVQSGSHSGSMSTGSVGASDMLQAVAEEYGFSVRPGAMLRRRASMVEWAAYLVAFMILFGVFGFLFATGFLHSTIDVFQVAIALIGTAFFGIFFWLARRGTALELQVDTAGRQLRTAVRNLRGDTRVIDSYSFDRVESIYVVRRAVGGKLCFKIADAPEAIETLTADTDTLTEAHLLLADAIGIPVLAEVKPGAAADDDEPAQAPLRRTAAAS